MGGRGGYRTRISGTDTEDPSLWPRVLCELFAYPSPTALSVRRIRWQHDGSNDWAGRIQPTLRSDFGRRRMQTDSRLPPRRKSITVDPGVAVCAVGQLDLRSSRSFGGTRV